MPRTRSLLSASLLALALSALACSGDSLTTPGTATLQITTLTTGPEPDPDGYTVQVDAGAAQPIGTAASIQITDISTGNHTVQLAGVAPNCSVSGDNPRTVTVAAAQTPTVSFAVTCGATSGGLQVTATTTGPSPDADGYTVTVDGSEHGTVSTTGVVSVGGLAPGDHAVGIGSVAANCQVQGDNPRSVTIAAGAGAAVAFDVICTAPPSNAGILQVITTTAGSGPDPDGYSFAVDGGATQPIGVNATATLANVGAGSHTVALSNLAANCKVGDNPRTVSVTAGATVNAAFNVTCSSTGLTLWTVMTGVTTDTMSDVWGTSSADVFAVGGQQILHYDGTRWTEQFRTPLSLGRDAWGLQGGFRGVWGTSSTNVYAVGGTFTANQVLEPRKAMIFHYDGTGWTEMARFSQDATDFSTLNAVWGSSPTDVFAVGAHEFESSSRTLIVHFDGQAWTPMAPPDNAADLGLYDVWGTSARDVYAVGIRGLSNPAGLSGALLHYDGARWTKVAEKSGVAPIAMWGNGSSDLFIATAGGSFLHYNGSTWSPMATPTRVAGNTWDIWGTSPTDLYAVSGVFAFGQGKQGAVYHYDGTTWVEETGGASAPLFGIWGSSPTDVYAVGGTILRGTQ